MPDYPEIFVLRHGQTEWNLAGRHQGRLDSPLTPKGLSQAADQGVILGNLLANRNDYTAVCSPQGRALKTAEIALSSVGKKPTPNDLLCEIHFGDWQGLTFDEITQGWPELCAAMDQDMYAWHFNAPNGESYDQIRDRAAAVLSSLTGPTVIVSHGITSRVLRGLWLGYEWDEMASLTGGQGCVYHLKDGQQSRIDVD